MPTKWDVVIGVIENPVSGLSPYERYEIEKADNLFDRFNSDPNWPINILSYTRNDISRHPGNNVQTWGAFKTNLNVLIGKKRTFVYVSDHSPAIPGPNALEFHGSQISPSIFASSLPQGPDEQHIVVIIGGDSGRFVQELCGIDLPGNFVIGSTSPGQIPLVDDLNLPLAMEGTDDPEVAFNKEFNRILQHQTPSACKDQNYVIIP